MVVVRGRVVVTGGGRAGWVVVTTGVGVGVGVGDGTNVLGGAVTTGVVGVPAPTGRGTAPSPSPQPSRSWVGSTGNPENLTCPSETSTLYGVAANQAAPVFTTGP